MDVSRQRGVVGACHSPRQVSHSSAQGVRAHLECPYHPLTVIDYTFILVTEHAT